MEIKEASLKIAIIGGGISGLSAGYYLSQQKDIEVIVIEKEPILGGLANSFLIDKKNFLEKYYHFICLPDVDYLNLIKELGLDGYLHWTKTKMGQFYNGELYPFGRVNDLFRFPHFSLSDKFKFGWGAFKAKKRDTWKDLEDIPAHKWLIEEFGQKAYEILYKPLLELKFFSYASRISAAWMWARINRLGNSRTKILQLEKLGYLEGGTHRFIRELSQYILQNGGRIIHNGNCKQIIIEQNKVKGVSVNDTIYQCDIVLSTVAIPTLLNLINNLSDEYFNNLKQIKYIGVICVLMRLEKPFSQNFWVNISDSRIPLAGIIEYTNLNHCEYLNGDSIIYIPQYLTNNDKRFSAKDDDIIKEYIDYLKIINPEFKDDWVSESYVFRDKYAQPICEVGFSSLIPTMKTPIDGLYITDSFQLHPDDRAVSHSIGLGKKVSYLIKSGLNK